MDYQDEPRLLALRKRQSREAADLYEEFLGLHPGLDGHTDHDDWSIAHSAAFRKFAAELSQRHKEERWALIIELDGKTSPLSEFELYPMRGSNSRSPI